jgi:small subunit ribosomal protein S8
MSMTDPVADMLTRVRNAIKAKFMKVDIPASNLKINVAKVLKDEGYIKNFKIVKDGKQNILRVYLKYGNANVPAMAGIERVSRPGLRVYVKAGDVKPVLGGLGTSILSTSKGVVADRDARLQNIGGELICKVW